MLERHKNYCQRCRHDAKDEDITISNQLEVLDLPHEVKQFVRSTYYRKLCGNCLKEMGELIHKSKSLSFPTKRHEFIEGVHFYMEDRYFVFTELYHLQKGYCCEGGCRHCAYGYKYKVN